MIMMEYNAMEFIWITIQNVYNYYVPKELSFRFTILKWRKVLLCLYGMCAII